ncbi:phosphoadenosine phosphosulfate sulfotransferase [Noviherbaspirillum sp. CPCC 100848]|uniref:Phosphoadenosine phosphosulfate sulfotransferase n=1 Tax=Noviherbaspirillum album TaxID=3080276 RepID=A0ABU6J9W8_9BURK|nr:phosphoadenosine phosphosulfate sulfotransferase [Noviherbaspirillum sp. CPCC 100848]MEC4720437.1 phosphoadenosine phosphosulfate sulfotransferase [Noviherbaspirillum sp. CPCC 100848]
MDVKTLELFRSEDIGLPLEDLIAMAEQSIFRLFANNVPVLVAFSSGKDSSTVANLVLSAAKKYVANGGHAVVLVTSSDTLVENPEVAANVRKELHKMEVYAKKHGIDLTTKIVYPHLLSTFQVKTLSGRGLPSFAGSSSDCTGDLKIQGQRSFRGKFFREIKNNGLPPAVTCLGTRYLESTIRAAKMQARSERAEEPVQNKDKEWVLSPICWWSDEDVWTYIGYASSGLIDSYSDFEEMKRIYSHSSGTSCVIVADALREGGQKKRTGGCGTRTGCHTCLRSEDKSLQQMVEYSDDYAYARGLIRFNKFLRNTQYDWSRRHWVGRTIREGYITVQPDTYHPRMVRELTRYMLQLDFDEYVRSKAAREPRKFTLLPLEMMITVDALQSLNGICTPFAIWADYRDIHFRGVRYDIPEVPAVPPSPIPDAKYLYVGKEWDTTDEHAGWNGLRDPLFEALTEGSGCMPEIRELKNGHAVWDIPTNQSFTVDPESAFMIFEFESENLIKQAERKWWPGGITAAYKWYLQYGALQLSHGQVSEHDEFLRRTAFKDRHGLTLEYDIDALLKRSISFNQLPDEARKAWAHKATTDSAQLSFLEEDNLIAA